MRARPFALDQAVLAFRNDEVAISRNAQHASWPAVLTPYSKAIWSRAPPLGIQSMKDFMSTSEQWALDVQSRLSIEECGRRSTRDLGCKTPPDICSWPVKWDGARSVNKVSASKPWLARTGVGPSTGQSFLFEGRDRIEWVSENSPSGTSNRAARLSGGTFVR